MSLGRYLLSGAFVAIFGGLLASAWINVGLPVAAGDSDVLSQDDRPTAVFVTSDFCNVYSCEYSERLLQAQVAKNPALHIVKYIGNGGRDTDRHITALALVVPGYPHVVYRALYFEPTPTNIDEVMQEINHLGGLYSLRLATVKSFDERIAALPSQSDPTAADEQSKPIREQKDVALAEIDAQIEAVSHDLEKNVGSVGAN